MTHSVMTKSQSLSDWLSYLEQIHPQQIDLGLTRVTEVAKRAGLLETNSFVITVGGTNGKGTTCAMLSSILNCAGYSTGVYASPHLLHYNERIRLNGDNATDAQICEALEFVESHRGETSLTFFEFGTLAALAVFKQAKPDVIILEVGLGGRLDATNMIDSDISVITSIDLDHCDWLGDTREAIATEKAGIVRHAKPVVVGEPDVPATLPEAIQVVNALPVYVGKDFKYQLNGKCWNFEGISKQLQDLPVPVLPLPNAATVLAVIEQLPSTWAVSEQAIRDGLVQANLSGRFQQISDEPCVIVDVAHNPHAARYLASKLSEFDDKNIIAVVGMLKDKDIQHTLDAVLPFIDRWYLADLVGPRAATAEMLSAFLPVDTVKTCFGDVKTAFNAAISNASAKDVIIVFGSFFTIADVLSLNSH